MDCFTTWSHLSQQLKLDPSHLVLLCGRVFSNKACLIRKGKKTRVKCLNEPENVMHLPKPLWWESIDSDECRIYVAIYVCCVTAEGAWPCSITWDLRPAWRFPSPALTPTPLFWSAECLISPWQDDHIIHGNLNQIDTGRLRIIRRCGAGRPYANTIF